MIVGTNQWFLLQCTKGQNWRYVTSVFGQMANHGKLRKWGSDADCAHHMSHQTHWMRWILSGMYLSEVHR